MRKFILISALLLASVSAEAGESRNLILASNDAPKAAETGKAAEPAKSFEARPAIRPEAATETGTEAKADTNTETASPARPARKVKAQRRESDEAKARRIAAKYGVYW